MHSELLCTTRLVLLMSNVWHKAEVVSRWFLCMVKINRGGRIMVRKQVGQVPNGKHITKGKVLRLRAGLGSRSQVAGYHEHLEIRIAAQQPARLERHQLPGNTHPPKRGHRKLEHNAHNKVFLFSHLPTMHDHSYPTL